MDNFLKILSSYFYKVFFVFNQKPFQNIYVSSSFLETVFDVVELQKRNFSDVRWLY